MKIGIFLQFIKSDYSFYLSLMFSLSDKFDVEGNKLDMALNFKDKVLKDLHEKKLYNNYKITRKTITKKDLLRIFKIMK